MKLLLEARDLSPLNVSEVLKWSVATFAGLGAYQTVAGASTVTQVLPTANSLTVSGTAGVPLTFLYKYGGGDTASGFNVSGTIPPGMTKSATVSSNTQFISGTPTTAGTYSLSIQAFDSSHSSAFYPFSVVITAPPAPTVSSSPTGGSFAPGDFVSLVVGHTNGATFTWKKGTTVLTTAESILTDKTSPRKYFVPSTTDIGSTWRGSGVFDDSAWTPVSGGIGYDTNTTVDYNPEIAAGGNTLATMSGTGKSTSVYIRIPFDLSTAGRALSYMKFRFQFDDGFVAFLNGTQIAARNNPATLLFNSAATAATAADSIAYTEIDVSQFLGSLRKGGNVLAIHGLNQAVTSSDFLFNCQLVAGIDATNSARLTLTKVSAADAGSYSVVVGNVTNTATSAAAVVTVSGVAPTISTPPAAVSINSGATATLSVVAAGDAPLAYQWFEGATGVTTAPVSGATVASFTTPALTATKSYWVRVTNTTGGVNSAAAIVTVIDPFVSWQSGQFSPAEAANPAISGPAADPDGDGVPNLLEYVLGSPPKGVNAGAVMKPHAEPPVGGGASQLVLRVPHIAVLGTATVTFQTAPSPASPTWTDVVNGVNGAVVSDAAGQYEIRLPFTAGALFVRMVVSQP